MMNFAEQNLEVGEDVSDENQAHSAAMTSTLKRRVKFLSIFPTVYRMQIIIDSYMI